MTLALISHPDCLLHEMGYGHPECPDRLIVIDEAIEKSGLKSTIDFHEAVPAIRDQLLAIHSAAHVDNIFNQSPNSDVVFLDPDTLMNPHTLRAALLAAGALVQAVDLVMTDAADAVFCNVRPPGHHAERDKAMGFCFFNNVAVGVAHALAHYNLERVAIVDFDVHHGNGTEDIFKDNPAVLYCSSFQHPFYPYSGAKTVSDHIINIPLPLGTSSESFRDLVKKHWLEAIRQFQPQLLFISAGFDAHAADPLAQLYLTEEDYFWITKEVKKIADVCCNGKVISTLEGGYALDVLGKCVVAHLKGLLSFDEL